jgi:hypothetical protein
MATGKLSIPAAMKDIRFHLKKSDVDTALEVLRNGMSATTTHIKTGRAKGAKMTVVEKPDHAIRVACAKTLLEFGFGKPAVTQRIELNGGDDKTRGDTSDEIAKRISDAGVDIDDVLDSYVKGLKAIASPEA